MPVDPSGARLLAVPPKGLDLIAQLAGAAMVTPCEGHGQGEFQLLQLMLALDLGAALQMTARRC